LARSQTGSVRLELLTEAIAALDGSQAKLELAHALVDYGQALNQEGRKADAREPLRRGLDLAHRCGAEPLEQRAHAELVAAGGRPRRRTVSGADSLTPSERRVAELAAAGNTNREIAQQLFVTEKTVERHLSQAYAKLAISSRGQLAEALPV